MLTGRVTYVTGFGRLGQADNPEPVASTVLAPLSVDLSQSSLAQVPTSQWGAGEWAIIIGGLFLLYSVTTTTRRGVARVSEYRQKRRKRLAEQHEAYAKQYRA